MITPFPLDNISAGTMFSLEMTKILLVRSRNYPLEGLRTMMSYMWERMWGEIPPTPALSVSQSCETFGCESFSSLIKGRTLMPYAIIVIGSPWVNPYFL